MLKSLPNSNISIPVLLVTVLFTLPVLSQTADEQYLAGCAQYIRGEYVASAESFTMAIERNNADYKLFIRRGASLLKNRETERALADFNEANIIYPGSADLWLAKTYALEGDQDNAIRLLKNHLNSPFRLPEDSIKKDAYFDKLQETADWYALWQKNWYDDAEKAVAEARYYTAKKQYDHAIVLLDDGLRKDVANTSLTFARGKVFFEQGLYTAAISDFTFVITNNKELTEAFIMRAIAYLQAGRYRDAINDFNRALKNDPGDFRLYKYRASAYAGQKEWHSAIRDISFYLKYFENDIQSLYQCGDYYYEAGDYMNALRCFNQVLKEEPNNSMFYKARGKTYLKTSTYQYAMKDLAMSLDLNPQDAETWMFMGLAKIKSGDLVNGCSDLERSGKMGNAEALKHIIDFCGQK
jgi:tetratricopeptide (TPR) repeat protein